MEIVELGRVVVNTYNEWNQAEIFIYLNMIPVYLFMFINIKREIKK